MSQEIQILIPIISVVLIFLLVLMFRKKIYKILCKIFGLIRDLFKGAIFGFINNKDVLLFLKNHPKIHAFLKNRFNKKNIYGLTLTKVIIVFFILLIWFYKLIKNYITLGALVSSDLRISHLLFYFRDTELINFFTFITNFGTPIIIVVFTLIFIVYAIFLNKRKFIIPMLFSVLFSGITNVILKNIFDRPRPRVSYYIENGFSFPSGHSTIAVAFYGFIAYFLLRNMRNKKKKVAIILFISILILLIGLSRMYLGAHYLSDVIGGFLSGGISLVFAVLISEILINKKEDHNLSFNKKTKRITYTVFFIAIAIALIFTIFHPKNTNIIQNDTNKITLNSLDNLSDDFENNNLNKYSETLSGKFGEPMSFFIVAKNDNEFLNFFDKSGWILARYPNLKSLAKVAMCAILNKEDSTAPMTPSFWNAQIHNFGFQKSTNEKTARKRHHVRFWKTNMVTDKGENIYIGTASFDKGIKWGITHSIDPDIDTERDFLFNDLKSTGLIKSYKKEKFVKPVLGRNFIGDYFFTNGEIYIIEL